MELLRLHCFGCLGLAAVMRCNKNKATQTSFDGGTIRRPKTLASGGAVSPWNMQFLPAAAAKKDLHSRPRIEANPL